MVRKISRGVKRRDAGENKLMGRKRKKGEEKEEGCEDLPERRR